MKNQIKNILIAITILFVVSTSYSATNDALYSISPGVRSSQDASLPIAQSIEEWNITVNKSLINLNNISFQITLPNSGNNQPWSVSRTAYYKYANGHSQWVGDVFDSNGKAGYMVINKINNDIFAVINASQTLYEIYTDNQIGTRLARVFDVANMGDTVSNLSNINKNQTKGTHVKVVEPNETSIVDVLILMDDDLDSVAYNKIISEELLANLILLNSEINNTPIPLRLNFLPIQTIDIPAKFQTVSQANLLSIATEKSITSNTIKNRYNKSNADYVVLYVANDGDGCGWAGQPRGDESDSSDFMYYFAMVANSCTKLAYTLLHELIHNFGSNHEVGLTYANENNQGVFLQVPYAHGYSRKDIASVLGCSGYDGTNQATTNCNRALQLSNGFDGLGDGARQDNVRFLSECTAARCRREEIANIAIGSNPTDAQPIIIIQTPSDGEEIPISDNYDLTADIIEDNIASVEWTVTKNGQIVSSGLGDPVNNYTFTTTAFSTSGNYSISAKVTDSIGAISIDTNVVSVVNASNIVPTLTRAGYQRVKVEVHNSGPSIAHNLSFDFSVLSNGAYYAIVNNLPSSCSMITFTDEANKVFNCQISNLAVNENFTVEWDQLCNDPISSLVVYDPDNIYDPTLHFNINIINLDEINLNMIKNDNLTVTDVDVYTNNNPPFYCDDLL